MNSPAATKMNMPAAFKLIAAVVNLAILDASKPGQRGDEALEWLRNDTDADLYFDWLSTPEIPTDAVRAMAVAKAMRTRAAVAG